MESILFILASLVVGLSSPLMVIWLDEWMESDMHQSVVELIFALTIPFTGGALYFTLTGQNPYLWSPLGTFILALVGLFGWLVAQLIRFFRHTLAKKEVREYSNASTFFD